MLTDLAKLTIFSRRTSKLANALAWEKRDKNRFYLQSSIESPINQNVQEGQDGFGFRHGNAF